MNQDEMEKELWRLRAVEIDLELSRESEEALKESLRLIESNKINYEQRLRIYEQKETKYQEDLLAMAKERNKACDDLAKANRENVLLRAETTRLANELHEERKSNYMESTYGVKIMNQPLRRNGRLSR